MSFQVLLETKFTNQLLFLFHRLNFSFLVQSLFSLLLAFNCNSNTLIPFVPFLDILLILNRSFLNLPHMSRLNILNFLFHRSHLVIIHFLMLFLKLSNLPSVQFFLITQLNFILIDDFRLLLLILHIRSLFQCVYLLLILLLHLSDVVQTILI